MKKEGTVGTGEDYKGWIQNMERQIPEVRRRGRS